MTHIAAGLAAFCSAWMTYYVDAMTERYKSCQLRLLSSTYARNVVFNLIATRLAMPTVNQAYEQAVSQTDISP